VTWSFFLVVVVLVLVPGADFALVVRTTLGGGRRPGALTVAGVSSAAMLQGALVAAGLAGAVVRLHALFVALRWAGVVYLAWLAFSMLRSAARGDYAAPGPGRRQPALAAYRQGFLCNATNPKILVFYLSLLSQFVPPDASWATWLVHAWMVPLLGTVWCLIIVAFVGSLRQWLQRRVVRRTLDAVSGLVLAGFCIRLASEA
jgi:threonine/homoserine/homoserine lactone efflux protein